MAILLVTVDLHAAARTAEGVESYLSGLDARRVGAAAWLVETEDKPATIRDGLNEVIEVWDRSLVTRLARDGWAGFGLACEAWLADPARRW